MKLEKEFINTEKFGKSQTERGRLVRVKAPTLLELAVVTGGKGKIIIIARYYSPDRVAQDKKIAAYSNLLKAAVHLMLRMLRSV